MGENTGNFEFLEVHSPQLAKLGRLAERYFSEDPPTALVKLRQFAEITAKEVAARQALLSNEGDTFDDVLRTLRSRSILHRELAELFYHLKRAGNAAAHEDRGTAGDALDSGFKIARSIGAWFHQTYANAPSFRLGPFVPPTAPADADRALRQELVTLRQVVATSANAEAKARLAAQEAETGRREIVGRAEAEARDRIFWEKYAADTETALRAAQHALADIQAKANVTPGRRLEMLAQAAIKGAEGRVDDHPRVLIDEQLRATGWRQVDSAQLRHAAGTRPGYGEAIAIAEWPTKGGPVDYALFVDGRCVGVVEAKRQVQTSRDTSGRPSGMRATSN